MGAGGRGDKGPAALAQAGADGASVARAAGEGSLNARQRGFGLVSLLVVAASAHADPACTLRIEVDRREPAWIRLRSVRPDAPGGCALDTDALRRTLAEALSDAGPAVSVALGRLIGYPELACGLAARAAADPGWDRRHGRARDGRSDNTWTAQALAASQRLAGLLPAGWSLQTVSVEKVLKGRPAQQLADCPVEGGGLPFDAQLWLRLRRR